MNCADNVKSLMSCPKRVAVAAIVKTASLLDILVLSNADVSSGVINSPIFAFFGVRITFSER